MERVFVLWEFKTRCTWGCQGCWLKVGKPIFGNRRNAEKAHFLPENLLDYDMVLYDPIKLFARYAQVRERCGDFRTCTYQYFLKCALHFRRCREIFLRSESVQSGPTEFYQKLC